MFDRFEKALEKCTCGRKPLSVLTALSGGADSTALLLLFAEMRKKKGIRVEAFHMNHGIRGAEADRDERFCRELCERLEIPLTVERVDVPAFCEKQKIGLEEGARILRYEALERVRKAKHLEFIATAHNGEDQLETLIFRLARGSGPRGLCGIPVQRGKIVRPLLSFEKKALEAFCLKAGAGYVTDSSNVEQTYARNKIRAQVVPVLKEICPGAVAAAGRLAESLREDEEFFSALLPAKNAGSEELRALAAPLLKRWLVRAYEDFCRKTDRKGGVEWEHIEQLCVLVRQGKTGDALSLPGKVKATLGADKLRFSEDKCAAPEYEERLYFGKVPLGATGWCASLMKEKTFDEFWTKNIKIHSLFMKVALNSATINKNLIVRSRRAGDRIVFGGMTRQVSKLAAATCKDPEKRKRYPVVCDEEGVLWVPGYPARTDAQPVPGKEKVYVLIGEFGHEPS